MPQGGKVIPVGSCPTCDAPHLYQVFHKDGFGGEELLETHCNQCGYALDGEGNLRRSPDNERLLSVLRERGK